MRGSVAKGTSFLLSLSKKRQLFFVTQCSQSLCSYNGTTPIRRQFYNAKMHWQQEPTPTSQPSSSPTRSELQLYRQNEYQSNAGYQILNRLIIRLSAFGKIVFTIIVFIIGWVFDFWLRPFFRRYYSLFSDWKSNI